ncbi:two-partner secretion domain-containing protein, partial [Endozoicomonas numazuensis]
MTKTITGQKDRGIQKSFQLNPLSYSFALQRRALAGGALALSFLGSEAVLAAPQGGVVVGGDGSISVDGKITNVDQVSDLLAIDWDSFNVDADEMVRFIQSSSSDMVLNRILDENPSAIFGTIDAKGHVLLVNPRGLLFTETSQINVNSFVASGLDIKTEDFMNGNYIFEGKAGTEGYVINKGSISAISGAVLQGKSVQNTGLISGGLVALAAGDEAVVTFDADKLIGVKVTREVLEKKLGVKDAVLNEGTLNGGEVLLTADVAKGLFDNAVNNTGIIEAKGISTEGGVVRLGGFGAQVAHSGKIDVSGEGAGSKGGKVLIEGDTINLTGNASIVATGENGGGTVLIGGDYQGKNADVYNAKNVTVNENVTIDASATENGDGGKVIVWSDDTAEFHGEITARGGKNGGDGGFVETSGKKLLKVTGTVDTGADQGENGKWLLDPTDISIVSEESMVDERGKKEDGSFVTIRSLESSLGDGSSIKIKTTLDDADIADNDLANDNLGNITVDTDIIYNNRFYQDTKLELIADNNIIINATIESKNDYDFGVTLDAQNTVHITSLGKIDTAGGTLDITTQNFINDGVIDLSGYVAGISKSSGIANIEVGSSGGDSFNKLGRITGFDKVNVDAKGNDTFVQNGGNIALTGGEDNEITLSVFSGQLENPEVKDVIIKDVEVVVSGELTFDPTAENANAIEVVANSASDRTDTLTGTLGNDTFKIIDASGAIKSKGITFQGIKIIDGQSDEGADGPGDTVDDSVLDSNWKLTQSGASKADASIEVLNVETVSTTGSVENASGSGKDVTLNASGLVVAGIHFTDSKKYTGYTDNTDNIIDSSGTGRWDITKAFGATS